MLLEARTHRPTLKGFAAESVVESANSVPKSADSITDFTIVGRLYISNMFNILNLMESADGKSADCWSRPTGNWPNGYGDLLSNFNDT